MLRLLLLLLLDRLCIHHREGVTAAPTLHLIAVSSTSTSSKRDAAAHCTPSEPRYLECQTMHKLACHSRGETTLPPVISVDDFIHVLWRFEKKTAPRSHDADLPFEVCSAAHWHHNDGQIHNKNADIDLGQNWIARMRLNYVLSERWVWIVLRSFVSLRLYRIN